MEKKCGKCGGKFATNRGLAIHDTRMHPYIAPPIPQPKKTVETAPSALEEEHNLVAGNNLELGDVVYLGRKTVITRITKTEGSRDVSVTLKITKKWWSKDPIS